MSDTAAKRDAETQLDRIEELARITSRQVRELRQALERLRLLIERIAGKE